MAALLAAVLVTSGCGVRPTGIITAGAAPHVGGQADPVSVYLVAADGTLTDVTRPGLPGRPYLPIEQLSVRPTGTGREHGLRTDVQADLAVQRGYTRDSLNVIVVPTAPLQRRPKWSRTAYGQIACTADAVPGVDRVALWGLPGRMNAMQLNCDDFSDLLG